MTFFTSKSADSRDSSKWSWSTSVPTHMFPWKRRQTFVKLYQHINLQIEASSNTIYKRCETLITWMRKLSFMIEKKERGETYVSTIESSEEDGPFKNKGTSELVHLYLKLQFFFLINIFLWSSSKEPSLLCCVSSKQNQLGRPLSPSITALPPFSSFYTTPLISSLNNAWSGESALFYNHLKNLYWQTVPWDCSRIYEMGSFGMFPSFPSSAIPESSCGYLLQELKVWVGVFPYQWFLKLILAELSLNILSTANSWFGMKWGKISLKERGFCLNWNRNVSTCIEEKLIVQISWEFVCIKHWLIQKLSSLTFSCPSGNDHSQAGWDIDDFSW